MKKLSLLVAFALILQMLFTAPAMAEGIDVNYTPLAVAYSKTADVYVMAAKNLSATDTPMKLYKSANGISWTETKSFASAKSPNSQSRFVLTYWENKNVFAVAAGTSVYYSGDGESWTELTKMSNNCLVSSYGDYLVVSTFAKIRVFTSLEDYKDVTLGGGIVWGKQLYVGDGEIYVADIQETTTAYAYYLTENDEGGFNQQTLYPNKVSASLSSVYIPEQKRWLNAWGKTTYNYQKNAPSALSVMLSDGKENNENITASAYFDKTAFLATENGSIYYTATTANLTSTTVWKKVGGASIGAYIYAMTAGENGDIVAVGKNASYLIKKETDGFSVIDPNEPVITFDNVGFIEAPVSGENVLEIKPVLKNFFGDTLDKKVALSADALPEGITLENKGNVGSGETAGVLKISDKVKDGCEVTLTAKCGSTEKNLVITVLAETEIKIIGEEKIIIPNYGEKDGEYTYAFEIFNQKGEKMAREGAFTAVSLPENVSFNEKTGVLTVPNDSEEGTAVLRATSKSKSSLYSEINVILEKNKPEKIIIDKSLEAFKLNSGKKTEIELLAEVCNKTGDVISSDILKWSVTDINGNELSGVTVDNTEKTVTFENGFSEAMVLIKAEAMGYSGIFAEIFAVVLGNDEKIAEEDLRLLAEKYSFIGLESDAVLPDEGKYGSKITWKSSDEDVISSAGKINASAEKRNATLTAYVEYGSVKLSYEFPVRISEYANIVKNGGFESGDLSNWSVDNAEINAENANEGKYSVKIAGSVSQEMSLEENHIYEIFGYVKGDGVTVKLSLGTSKLAEIQAGEGYKMLSEVYTAKASGKYILKLSGNGEFFADSITVYDITEKYAEITSAVEKAEGSKIKADCDYAKMLVSSLVASTAKEAFSKRISDIETNEYAELELGSYSFVKSAYNKQKNILVAVAKNFASDKNPARVYTSLDGGATWKLTLSAANAKNSSHNDTKQVITYWEKNDAFAVILGKSVYYSYDGEVWTEIPALETSDGFIVSNGDKLFVAGARTGKSAADLSGAYTEVVSSGGANFYAGFALVSDGGYGFYQHLNVGIGYPTTAYYMTMDTDTGKLKSTGYWPSAYGMVSDVSYVSELSKWILTTSNTSSYRFFTEPNTITGEKKVTDDETNGYTTALYDAKKLYLANKEKKIFVGDASDITKITGWKELSYEKALDSEAASMEKLANGDIIVFSQKDIYMIKNNTVSQKQKEYKLGFLEELRCEVPQKGERKYTFTAECSLYDGSNPPWKIVGIKPSKLPDGISFKEYEQDGALYCDLIVSDYAKGGENVFVSVSCSNGITKELEISVVSENDIVLGGKTLITVPMAGEEAETYKYSPAILGQDGEIMESGLKLTVMSKPENILYNDEEKSFTLSSLSGEGVIVVKLSSLKDPTLSEIYKITVEKRRVEYVKFGSSEDIEAVIPDSGALTLDISAYAYDQADMKLKTPVSYEITDGDGNVKENVSGVGGVLKIYAEACEGTAKIKAFADGFGDERKLKLTYSDERMLKEDYEYILRLNSFSKMEKNADLPTVGLYGSEIKYKTSNDKVITADGLLTRDYTKNTSAILTITLTLNGKTLQKSVNVISLKADNIASNGSLEDGTTLGWSGDGIFVTTDSKSGDYALSASNGASYTLQLKADRTYAVTIFVKSNGGKTATLKVNGEKLSELKTTDSYKMLDGIFTLSKNSDGTAVVKIEGEGLTIDELTVFEITSEYEALISLIETAEKTRTKSAVEKAKKALDAFYDLSVKDELSERIGKINIKTEGGSTSGSTSTSNKSYKTPSSAGILPDYTEIVDYELLTFKDLDKHWAKDDVEYMANLGFINGKSEGVFDPDAYITRAEFATLLIRTMGLSETPYENSFFDVTTEDWFAKSVQTAKNKGYISGSNGLFRPNDLILREEMTKMLACAYSEKSGKAVKSGKAIYYNDVYDIGAWAYDYIAFACEEGLVNGMTENIFAPKANATRAQAAVMLRRIYDKE